MAECVTTRTCSIGNQTYTGTGVSQLGLLHVSITMDFLGEFSVVIRDCFANGIGLRVLVAELDDVLDCVGVNSVSCEKGFVHVHLVGFEVDGDDLHGFVSIDRDVSGVVIG